MSVTRARLRCAGVVPSQPTVEEDLARLGALEGTLDELGAALVALDGGSYGICAGCGLAVPDEILAGDPLARRCSDCAR